ncbi:MAG: hypothetical protein KF819_08165 [Labilithrix sp.]|nr:hypothetical protein [Labilithrix sp.]
MNPFAWARSEVLHFAWERGWYQPPDRRVLEEEILASLAADPACRKILFVGVKWYTAPYAKAFAGKTFATIDPEPEVARFGGDPHAVDVVQNLEKHFAGTIFDAVVMSGVIGWGINDVPELDKTLTVCADAMRPGAWLILGVNELTPNHVDANATKTIERFEPKAFGKRTSPRIDIPLPFKQKLHTFLFWQKK